MNPNPQPWLRGTYIILNRYIRKHKFGIFLLSNYKLDNNLLTVEPRAVDPHCFDADPEPDPDPAQNLDADPDPDPDPDPGGGGRGGRDAINVHPPWQNPRYAPAYSVCPFSVQAANTTFCKYFRDNVI